MGLGHRPCAPTATSAHISEVIPGASTSSAKITQGWGPHRRLRRGRDGVSNEQHGLSRRRHFGIVSLHRFLLRRGGGGRSCRQDHRSRCTGASAVIHTLERPDERGRWAVKACMQAAQRAGWLWIGGHTLLQLLHTLPSRLHRPSSEPPLRACVTAHTHAHTAPREHAHTHSLPTAFHFPPHTELGSKHTHTSSSLCRRLQGTPNQRSSPPLLAEARSSTPQERRPPSLSVAACAAAAAHHQ